MYDEETKLYYCESRYFSHATARWLNADDRIPNKNRKLYPANVFSYCINNPLSYVDKGGHFISGLIGTILAIGGVVGSVVVTANHSYNAGTTDVYEAELQDSYTVDEAETAINGILSQYADDCFAKFDDAGVQINRSYLVDDRKTRQKVCMIISRTGLTDREADNLSAEWNGHNICYALGILEGRAEHTYLDFEGDDDYLIYIGTGALEMLGFD